MIAGTSLIVWAAWIELSPSSVSVISFLIFLIGVAAFTNRAYYHQLQRNAHRLLKKAGHGPNEPEYSLHEIIYTISLPSYDPTILRAQLSDFYVIEERESWLYPSVSGLRVVLRTGEGPSLSIAYLGLAQYRAMLLDKLLLEKHITPRQYQMVAAASLLLPETKERLISQVHQDIHKQPYG